MKKQSLTGSWEFRQVGTDEWVTGTVPGGVHTDLMALGRIPDPFVGDNELAVQWVAEADWVYRRRFTAEQALLNQPHLWLVCEGLDTLATVTLNGQTLGQTNNMFRQYRWDVKALLQPVDNELLITFDSPVAFVKAQQAVRPMQGVSQAIAGGPHLRKAPCQFGWDWGPQLPPIGIWKEIRLEGTHTARLTDVHLRQSHAEGQVKLSAAIVLERLKDGPLTVKMHVTTPGGEEIARETAIAAETTLSLAIDQPQLWWPNGFGEQPLYQVAISLHHGAETIDQRHYQVGLRTIVLRQDEDEWGRSFEFVVNGVPIFAKGSNWIPADSFPTRISDEMLDMLIRSAAETHQNMLRVWGGGFYEEERFYDLCDRYGILVWQDFIFSCSIYPLDEADFHENVRLEVEENVKRLRHRASLALWCGNNEMEWGWESWGWADQAAVAPINEEEEEEAAEDAIGKYQPHLPDWQRLQQAYKRFFHTTLADWVAELDPDNDYWPSSPSSNTPFKNVNGQKQGDAHYWDVWHGRKPFTAYRDQFPRFMSEFGFQALPPLKTIRTYAEEKDWNMTSYIMERHQKNDSGNSLMVGQMLDTFRLPKDFASLVYLSMVLQAEGIRYGVEHWRRYRDRVAGTLYWQLNDCWPVASWSSLDYFGRWKALHYASRNFYAPVILSIEDAPPHQRLFITNDQPHPWTGSVKWSLETLSGETILAGEEPALVEPLSTTPVADLDFSGEVNLDNRRNLIFIAELWQGEERQALKTAFFSPTKHLELSHPKITVSCRIEGQTVHIGLIGRSLARLVEVALAGQDVVFSDNYFDLPAGRSIIITCPLPAGWSLNQVESALTVRSVYDSFANR